MPDGSTQPISTLNVRATEYTVGENGPQAMPAELPPTSGYTYAVEFTVDEAMAAGATDVRFDQPLSFYLENFLDFPVGGIVPVGFYDRQQGQWIPSENGLIIEVVAITGGLADLDLDGDGLADDAAALAALGITDAEREELATLYRPGQSLWRVPITHFTPWDCNWPQGPGPNDRPPNQPRPRGGIDDNRSDDYCLGPAGSVIGCQNQTLGESIPVNGTPFALNYISDSVPGRKDAYTLEIPLNGDDMPASASRIELEIFVAGQNLTQIFPALPNQTHTFTWDALDAYGRTVHGAQPVTVRIGYVYGLVYLQPSAFGELQPSAFGEAFARFSSSSGGEGVGGSVIVGNQARQEVTNWQDWKVSIGTRDVRGLGLGAWTLSMHHVYDPLGRVLYRGDGRQRSASQLERILVTVAGTGEFGGCLTTLYPSGCSGDDGGPATQAQLANPDGVAISPDGTLYIAESSGNCNRIRRVDPEGNITTLAGTGADCRPPTDPCGDGGQATDAKLYFPYAVAVHPDGSIYIADHGSKRIRRVGPEGNITTVAGTGGDCHPLTDPCGDGGPANQAPLGTPIAVAVHPDGSIYIAAGRRIRRVGPDGIITTVAGDGGGCNSGDSCGDGGPATAAEVNAVGLALGPDGALFIADFFPSSRIRRVGPDGIISTVAGGGLAVGDGGPATAAKIKRPIRVAVGPDGSIYIADWGSHRIRLVRPDGIITTVARTADTGGSSGEGGGNRGAAFKTHRPYRGTRRQPVCRGRAKSTHPKSRTTPAGFFGRRNHHCLRGWQRIIPVRRPRPAPAHAACAYGRDPILLLLRQRRTFDDGDGRRRECDEHRARWRWHPDWDCRSLRPAHPTGAGRQRLPGQHHQPGWRYPRPHLPRRRRPSCHLHRPSRQPVPNDLRRSGPVDSRRGLRRRLLRPGPHRAGRGTRWP